MKEWQVVAILERSAGNETVGEMWQETKVFDHETPLIDVIRWASNKANPTRTLECFTGNLKLTIAQ